MHLPPIYDGQVVVWSVYAILTLPSTGQDPSDTGSASVCKISCKSSKARAFLSMRLPSFIRSSGDPAGTNRRQTNPFAAFAAASFSST